MYIAKKETQKLHIVEQFGDWRPPRRAAKLETRDNLINSILTATPIRRIEGDKSVSKNDAIFPIFNFFEIGN